MAWWDQIGALSREAVDWLNRTSAAGAGALNRSGQALLPEPSAAPSPPPAPPGPSSTTEMTTPPPAAAEPPPAVPSGPAKEPTTLERFQGQLTDVETAIKEAERAASGSDENAAASAKDALPALRTLRTAITSQIAAEQNRLRDEAAAAAKEEKDKKATPVNGQTREVPFDYKLPNGQTVTGIKTEEYQNGVWGYVAGSSRKEPGATPQGAAQITNQVLNDGRGAYWTYDQATGKATPINGPAAAVKTVNDPDGSVWTQNPDGSKGTKLFEGLPQTYEADGFIVGVDRRNGSQVFKVDTKTAEGRALADRLQRANVETAERAGEPKFASAIAQYQQEVQRRQTLARTELQRLQDLQKSGQLSPDQAEAQFDRWMTTNVEGPLSGFRAAAEQEHQRQEQENLTRQTAENTRVETANRERGRLGYEAGETAKAQALQVGLQTRSPAYLAQMGNFAQSLGQGKTDFQFDPKALDVAGFQAVQPNYTAVADQAMQRLFGMLPEAKAQNVNSPLPALPTGPDLRSLMDGVKYGGPSASGALSAPIEGDPGLPGQQAVDLKDQGKPGYARTVYANGRYFDWAIPQAGGAAAAPQVAPPTVAPPSLPGQLPGETPEQRQARFAAILARPTT